MKADKLFRVLRRIAGVERSGDYFFIVGCPRSGTTLLSVLLDRHTRLCVPPETGFFDEVAPGLVPNDQRLLLDVLLHWPRLAELGLEPQMVANRLRNRRWNTADVLTTILDLYAMAQNKMRCGEKTPQHLMHVPTILAQFPGAKVICVLRDGRNAALSLASMPWWPDGNLESAANLWKLSARLTQTFAQQYPRQFLVVRYEKLVADPVQELTSIMNYLGETFESDQLRADLPSRAVLSRSMKWKGDALGPMNASRINQRQNAATAQELAFLEKVLGEELRLHGY